MSNMYTLEPILYVSMAYKDATCTNKIIWYRIYKYNDRDVLVKVKHTVHFKVSNKT